MHYSPKTHIINRTRTARYIIKVVCKTAKLIEVVTGTEIRQGTVEEINLYVKRHDLLLAPIETAAN